MPGADFADFYSSGAASVMDSRVDESGSCQQEANPVGHFRHLLLVGIPWHRALLETMGQWTLPEEFWNERRYKYIVGREAFDWLLLAERLCAEVGDVIPTEELEMLLFHGVLPEPIETEEFRSLLGASKHQGYLNYHYGIVLEEALQLAAEENIRKRHIARGYTDNEDLVEDAFRHLYTDSRYNLLDEFRRIFSLASRRGFSITDLKGIHLLAPQTPRQLLGPSPGRLGYPVGHTPLHRVAGNGRGIPPVSIETCKSPLSDRGAEMD